MEKEYESLGRIPKTWYVIFAHTFAGAILLNSSAELFFDWRYAQLGTTFITRTVNLMAFIVGLFFIIAHLWETLEMLFYRSRELKERLREEGRQEGRQEERERLLGEREKFLSELKQLVEQTDSAPLKAFVEEHASDLNNSEK